MTAGLAPKKRNRTFLNKISKKKDAGMNSAQTNNPKTAKGFSVLKTKKVCT
jgi:hypothetical protein